MKLPDNVVPLVDGDWILYLACFAVEYPIMKDWKEKVKDDPSLPEPTPSYEDTIDVFENKIKEIKLELETESPPILLFTGENNFRKEVAKTKEYKGNRVSEKPFHYQNLKTYIETRYDTDEDDGLEADDLMAIWQSAYPDKTCIVTVDKDLRQVNGWHYSPEGVNYGSWGPRYCTDENSYVAPKRVDKVSDGLEGSGYMFFYSQLITGDTVDNIPGLPKHGPHAALKILEECESEAECFEAVRDAYRDVCLLADEYMEEQARLLWMVRSDGAGQLVYWTPPVVGEASETN